MLGVATCGSVDDLLARVDAAVFAIPPDVHTELAERATLQGKHLLLDKSVATSVGAADRVATAVEQAEVASVVFFTSRFNTATRALLLSVTGASWDGARARWLVSALGPDSPYAGYIWRRERGALWDAGPVSPDERGASRWAEGRSPTCDSHRVVFKKQLRSQPLEEEHGDGPHNYRGRRLDRRLPVRQRGSGHLGSAGQGGDRPRRGAVSRPRAAIRAGLARLCDRPEVAPRTSRGCVPNGDAPRELARCVRAVGRGEASGRTKRLVLQRFLESLSPAAGR